MSYIHGIYRKFLFTVNYNINKKKIPFNVILVIFDN